MSFCPLCGKKAADIFCEQHIKERRPLIKKIKPFEVYLCSICSKLRYRTRWLSIDSFNDVVIDHCVFDDNAIIHDIDIPPLTPLVKKDFEFEFTVIGSVSEHISYYEEKYFANAPVHKVICDRCKRIKGDYFEGIMQLRRPTPEAINYIEKHVQNTDVKITKTKEVRGGVDFYFTDQKYLAQFVHHLRKLFGGEVKTQSKLHTYDHKTSKKVFRLTALIRLPGFHEGDIIETSSRMIRVTKLGSMVQGFDIKRNKKTSIPCPKDNEYTILTPVKVVVSSVKPQITILDPEEFQEVRLLSQGAELTPGQEVMVVRDDMGQWYLSEKQYSQ